VLGSLAIGAQEMVPSAAMIPCPGCDHFVTRKSPTELPRQVFPVPRWCASVRLAMCRTAVERRSGIDPSLGDGSRNNINRVRPPPRASLTFRHRRCHRRREDLAMQDVRCREGASGEALAMTRVPMVAHPSCSTVFARPFVHVTTVGVPRRRTFTGSGDTSSSMASGTQGSWARQT
jgi:hypothetical protein